jgi:hypothetical protein
MGPSLAQQFEPGGPSLTICGHPLGYVVVRDRVRDGDGVLIEEHVVAGPFHPFREAERALHEIRSHRAFAAETLRHLLTTQQPGETDAL